MPRWAGRLAVVVREAASVIALLEEGYGSFTRAVEGLAPADFGRRTLAEGWSVRDLLFHQLLDAQRALIAFASPTTSEPDVDEVSYWKDYRPGQGDWSAAHADFVRVASSAYADPQTLVEHWRTTSEAAVRAASMADAAGRVETQGHVLTVPDFVSTLVLETTVHLLDLTVELPSAPSPSPDALALVRSVLESLFGGPLPSRWDDTDCALKGTGRLPLSDADRAELGDRAAAVPLLG